MLKSLFARFLSAPEPIGNYYLSACCIVKDENEYLEEWIRYHLHIGVEHFFIYDNGSAIPVKETIHELGLTEFVTVIYYPGKNKHVSAYSNCLKTFGKSSQWIAYIDVDEFIVPKNANHSLPEFLLDYEGYGGLGVNWLIFGSSGHTKRTHQPQLESFTFRSEPVFSPNNHIKSIVQPKYVKSAFKSHCFRYIDGKKCVNENLLEIKESFSENSVSKIQLNHYYCRSLEEYHNKIKRGISDTKRERKIEEFHHHDQKSNKVNDTLILEVLKTRKNEPKKPSN